jgi:hypothetical protein
MSIDSVMLHVQRSVKHRYCPKECCKAAVSIMDGKCETNEATERHYEISEHGIIAKFFHLPTPSCSPRMILNPEPGCGSSQASGGSPKRVTAWARSVCVNCIQDSQREQRDNALGIFVRWVHALSPHHLNRRAVSAKPCSWMAFRSKLMDCLHRKAFVWIQWVYSERLLKINTLHLSLFLPLSTAEIIIPYNLQVVS